MVVRLTNENTVISTHEVLRDRLFKAAGLVEPKPSRFKPSDLKLLEETEWSPVFERLMRNRLLMGAFRYGTFAEKKIQMQSNDAWDLLEPITKKVRLYNATGNTEYLVDAANYLMLAFEFDPHPRKHFVALDDHHDHCKRKRDITKGNTSTKVGPCCVCGEGFQPKEAIHTQGGRNYHRNCLPLKDCLTE